MLMMICLWTISFSSLCGPAQNQSRAVWIGDPSAGVGRLKTALWGQWWQSWSREWALPAPWVFGVFRVLPRSWAAVLCSSDRWRSASSQIDSASVGICGGARGLSAGAAGWTSLDCENPPHIAWLPTCWPSRGGSPCSRSSSRWGACSRCWTSSRCGPSRSRFSSRSWLSGGSGGRRALLARCRHLTRPLALCPGHEVVAVAVATSIPEVHTLGGDDIVVVAGYPAAAGAGSARQGADRALNCSKETEQVKLPVSVINYFILRRVCFVWWHCAA